MVGASPEGGPPPPAATDTTAVAQPATARKPQRRSQCCCAGETAVDPEARVNVVKPGEVVRRTARLCAAEWLGVALWAILIISTLVAIGVRTQQYAKVDAIDAGQCSSAESGPVPGAAPGDLMHFVHLSDTHISILNDVWVGRFRTFVQDYLSLIQPTFVVHTGDIAHSEINARLFQWQMTPAEYQMYKTILQDNGWWDSPNWLDIRGNHDAVGVYSLDAPSNLYNSFGVSGRRKGHHDIVFTFVQEPLRANGTAVRLVMVDAAPEPGLPLPFNIITDDQDQWVPRVEAVLANATFAQRTDLLTIVAAHYPIASQQGNKFLESLRTHKIAAYLCGHTHEARWHGRFDAALLELEVDDMFGSAGYRVMAVDHGRLSFTDLNLGQLPIIHILNPHDARFYSAQVSSCPAARSTHIRALVFSNSTLTSLTVEINGARVCSAMTAVTGHIGLYVCPWNPSSYATGVHTIAVFAADAHGRSTVRTIPFSIDGTGSTIEFTGSRYRQQVFIVALSHGILVASSLLLVIGVVGGLIVKLAFRGRRYHSWVAHGALLQRLEALAHSDDAVRAVAPTTRQQLKLYSTWYLDRVVYKFVHMPRWLWWCWCMYLLGILTGPLLIGPFMNDGRWGFLMIWGIVRVIDRVPAVPLTFTCRTQVIDGKLSYSPDWTFYMGFYVLGWVLPLITISLVGMDRYKPPVMEAPAAASPSPGPRPRAESSFKSEDARLQELAHLEEDREWWDSERQALGDLLVATEADNTGVAAVLRSGSFCSEQALTALPAEQPQLPPLSPTAEDMRDAAPIATTAEALAEALPAPTTPSQAPALEQVAVDAVDQVPGTVVESAPAPAPPAAADDALPTPTTGTSPLDRVTAGANIAAGLRRVVDRLLQSHSPEARMFYADVLPSLLSAAGKVRREVWSHLAEGASDERLRRENVTAYFAQLLATATNADPAAHAPGFEQHAQHISQDVPRTNFDGTAVTPDSMKHLLLCFCVRNPVVGYAQGMNRIAITCLSVEPYEPAAFAVFCYLVEDVIGVDHFDEMLSGTHNELALLSHVLVVCVPTLAEWLTQVPMPLSWLLTPLYVTLCPVPDSPPSWWPLFDLCLAAGYRPTVHILAATLLESATPLLTPLRDESRALEVLASCQDQWRPPHLSGAHMQRKWAKFVYAHGNVVAKAEAHQQTRSNSMTVAKVVDVRVPLSWYAVCMSSAICIVAVYAVVEVTAVLGWPTTLLSPLTNFNVIFTFAVAVWANWPYTHPQWQRNE